MLLNNRKNTNGKKLTTKEGCKIEEDVSPITTPTIIPARSKDFII
jgi:hypothetical protein